MLTARIIQPSYRELHYSSPVLKLEIPGPLSVELDGLVAREASLDSRVSDAWDPTPLWSENGLLCDRDRNGVVGVFTAVEMTVSSPGIPVGVSNLLDTLILYPCKGTKNHLTFATFPKFISYPSIYHRVHTDACLVVSLVEIIAAYGGSRPTNVHFTLAARIIAVIYGPWVSLYISAQ